MYVRKKKIKQHIKGRTLQLRRNNADYVISVGVHVFLYKNMKF